MPQRQRQRLPLLHYQSQVTQVQSKVLLSFLHLRHRHRLQPEMLLASIKKPKQRSQLGHWRLPPPPEHMIKYTKMLKMGLPEGAVRLKMEQEGISASDAEALLQAVS